MNTNFSRRFQLPKHRFKLCQTALLSVLSSSNLKKKMFQKSVKMHKLAFLFSTFSQLFQKLFQKVLKCTSQRVCFQHFLSSSNIVSNCIRMHHTAALFSFFPPEVPSLKNIVLKSVGTYQLASLISNFLSSLNFQNIVSKSVRRNRLASLISFFFNIFLSLSGKYFQGENPSSLHIPISSKFYFAHATPLMHEQQMYCMETLTRHS